MAEHTKIEWATHTFNGWRGCTKVSPGCKNCYAEKLVTQRLKGEWGPGAPRQLASDAMWHLPMRWERKTKNQFAIWNSGVKHYGSEEIAIEHGFVRPERPRVFCSSLSDLFDFEVPGAWRVRLFNLIDATPHLDWLLLTKRPESWSARLHEAAGLGAKLALSWLNGEAPANIWIGTSVEDQQRADERIPELLDIPAQIRFLSCEPLLGPVDLRAVANDGLNRINALAGLVHVDGRNEPVPCAQIDWVIVGGESGPDSRPFAIEWAEDLRLQCRGNVATFFMKQFGAHPFSTNINFLEWPEQTHWATQGEGFASARAILRDRKGGDMTEWPEELRVRQLPNKS